MVNISLPKIGIFDSGVGGLTVFKEIRKAFPHNDIVYLGDTARVPYGPKSKETIIEYSLQNTRFYLEDRDFSVGRILSVLSFNCLKSREPLS